MRWKAKDVFRWRCRFAFLPRQIGDEWVWLERFEWRFAQLQEDDLSLRLHSTKYFRRAAGSQAEHEHVGLMFA